VSRLPLVSVASVNHPVSKLRRRNGPPGAGGPSVAAGLSRGRRWGFRLALLLGVPVLLLGGLEVVLRLAGYGYSTSFFRREVIGGQACWVENDRFGLQFFPSELSRSPPPVVMRDVKPPGGCRIFVLGESAALGDPRPAYGASRYLQCLLRERYPAGDFEVICVAMTAINSHALVKLARECARRDGDIWILYLGNNEMVGPFGAMGVLGPAAPPWPWVRAYLAVQETRVGQWLAVLARRLRPTPVPPGGWAGMKMFVKHQLPPDAPVRAVVHRNFQRNLDDILAIAERAGVKVVLSTMAVNLRDCPPFASLSGGDVPASARQAREQHILAGVRAEAAGQWAAAAEHFEGAVAADPQWAEAHYRLGQCLARLGRTAAARASFETARDLDALPFRADSRLNALIREAASRRAGAGLRFVDAEATLAALGSEGIPGQEVFYEHVHLNNAGNYALARAWAEAVSGWLPVAWREAGRPAWASQETCERRLGLTDWNRVAVLEEVLARLGQPPFPAQANHQQRLEQLQAALSALRKHLTPTNASAARALYLDTLAAAPGDHRLHENYAEFLEAIGDLAGAAEQWETVAGQTPHHHLGHFQLGRLRARLGQWPEAEAALKRAVARRPDLSEGWLELGKVHLARERPDQALAALGTARRLLPQDWRAAFQMGRAWSRLNRHDEAMTALREALRLQPEALEARYLLGEELAFAGRTAEARAAFEAVLQGNPKHLAARLNLGVALVQEGRLEAAATQFREALRADPQNAKAADYLRQVEKRLNTAAGSNESRTPDSMR